MCEWFITEEQCSILYAAFADKIKRYLSRHDYVVAYGAGIKLFSFITYVLTEIAKRTRCERSFLQTLKTEKVNELCPKFQQDVKLYNDVIQAYKLLVNFAPEINRFCESLVYEISVCITKQDEFFIDEELMAKFCNHVADQYKWMTPCNRIVWMEKNWGMEFCDNRWCLRKLPQPR
uniref:Uncharacterized protein n=1 Tax=Abalone asfa-like virus TaxID=2839893 RepID=A0A5K7Y0U8_9VIRU|nr:hypothetical protein [Abalone asfa-like virus]BCY04566.1 hypothetical protein [Abalone asfa-like virus]